MAAVESRAESETLTEYRADSATACFARVGLGLSKAQVPDLVWQYLKCCVADAIGIAFASHHYDFAERTRQAIDAFEESGPAVAIGCDRLYPARDAALINGVLIHGLDYDDTHLPSVVHCSASALPTALALAHRKEISGTDLLMAVLVALEIDGRLGAAAGGIFQELGFHPTGVVGIFGATVAAVRLLGGSELDAINAQGVALSMAGGSMAFLDEGAWTKRLHPGWASSSALTAARLAMSGFQAPHDAYGGRFGFYSLFTRNASPAATLDWQPDVQPWALDEVAIKPYPVCHFNHAPIDAALALREQHGFNVADIDHVVIKLDERQFGVVVDPIERKRQPKSEYDAKFSAPYAVATALTKRRFGLQELDEDHRCDPATLALAKKITCEHDGRSRYPQAFSGGVEITLKTGETFCHFEAVNRGAAGRLLEETQVRQKFIHNCRLVLSDERSKALWDTIWNLDAQPDCGEFLSALRGLS